MTTAVARRDAVHPIVAVLEDRSDAIAALLPHREDLDRFKRVVLQSINRNPDLRECTPDSLADAAMEAARLGLEPSGAIGGAHLVKYGNKAQLIVDYRGLLQLARRSGEIAKVTARLVHEGDTFEVRYGSAEGIVHVADLGAAKGAPVTHVYAIASLRSGEEQFEVMTADEVEAIRARSRAGNGGPWRTDWGEMAKKTVLRRLCKLLPLSIEARAAIEHEDAFERVPVTVSAPPPAALADRLAQRREALALDTTEQPVAEVGSSGPTSAPASPGCDHRGTSTTATAQGVVCECGVLIAAREATAASTARPRRSTAAAPKTPEDPDYWPARLHAVAAERGIDHEGVRVILAGFAEVPPGKLAGWSSKKATEEQYAAADAFIRELAVGEVEDATATGLVWTYAVQHGLIDPRDTEAAWTSLNTLARLATGGDPDDFTPAQWLAFAARVQLGHFDKPA